MKAICIHVVLCILSLKTFENSAKTILQEYEAKRNYIISEESYIAVGGDVELTLEEQEANKIIMKLKQEELNLYYMYPELFNLSKPLRKYKQQLDRSKLYQILKMMPKGAALHLHSTLTLDADYFMPLTYIDSLYACITNNELQLKFSGAPPAQPCNGNWTLLSEIRSQAKDIHKFDEKLKQFFMLHPDDENCEGSDVNTIWKRFEMVYRLMKSLITYRTHREKFLFDFLQKCYNENIMYVEVRSGLHKLQDSDGTLHDPIFMAKLYRDVLNEFKKTHPDFVGMKLIFSRHRHASLSELKDTLSLANKLKKEVPELFAGFDLVGQEDLGQPLSDFLPALVEAKDEGMNFFFHAGETNWYGNPSDRNLVDAILLGTKRIGHGYSLIRHPVLLSVIRKEEIALEVSIVSNLELSLLKDVRNHPLGTYLALGIPVVLSSDDPGIWGSDILTTDFYIAFVAIASREADLRLLKQLALNSIKYSALNKTEKDNFLNSFETKWYHFIRNIIDNEISFFTEKPKFSRRADPVIAGSGTVSATAVPATHSTTPTTTTHIKFNLGTKKITTKVNTTTTTNKIPIRRSKVNDTYLFDETEPDSGEETETTKLGNLNERFYRHFFRK